MLSGRPRNTKITPHKFRTKELPCKGSLFQQRLILHQPHSKIKGHRKGILRAEVLLVFSATNEKIHNLSKEQVCKVIRSMFIISLLSTSAFRKCGKFLPGASSLREHMLYYEGVRDYQCEICQKRFYRKSHLNIHMKTHSGERPFTCELCDQKFKLKDTLKI